MSEGSVRVACVVDNAVGDAACWGEHGLSFLIEAGGRRILFDTGLSGSVLGHNLDGLRIQTEDVEAIVLSHGHSDHSGGLRVALRRCPKARVVAHPDVFMAHLAVHEGRRQNVGCPVSKEQIEYRASLHLSRTPIEVVPGLWTTGEVPRTLTPGTLRKHLMMEVNGRLELDTFPDDQSLAIQTEQGLILVLGCCHSGLRNTLLHVRQVFGSPLRAVIGGSHLAGEGPEELARIVALLREQYGDTKLYLNHCTGIPVLAVLRAELGERVSYCEAGTRLVF
jgi:7,8-dihydropterin-6-yl-methyl-4-(beta-D-ribofuranosyl)aminobenzene 5'-phosphate synthase